MAKTNIVFILLWGVILGGFITILPTDYLFIHKIFFHVCIFLSIHFFYNRIRKLHETFIIFGMLSGWIYFLSACSAKLIILFSFDSQASLFIGGQLLILCLVMLTLLLPIDKLYKISKKSITTEWTFYFLATTFFVYLCISKFNALELANQAIYMVLIMAISVPIYWKRLVQYEQELKMKENNVEMMQYIIDSFAKRLHKVDNVMSSISGAAIAATSLDEFIEVLNQYTSTIEMKQDMKNIITADNKFIAAFIHAKKQKAIENGKDIITDIQYINKCLLIKDHIIIVDLLGELLDNAIQNSKEHTNIYIRMQVDEYKLFLEVENQHEWFNVDERKNIFTKGHTSNKNTAFSRGYGLSNVDDAVKEHHGKIDVINSHDENENEIVIFQIIIAS